MIIVPCTIYAEVSRAISRLSDAYLECGRRGSQVRLETADPSFGMSHRLQSHSLAISEAICPSRWVF